MASPGKQIARNILDSQKAFKRLALRHQSPTSPLSFQSILGCLDISRSSAKPNASEIRDKQRSPLTSSGIVSLHRVAFRRHTSTNLHQCLHVNRNKARNQTCIWILPPTSFSVSRTKRDISPCAKVARRVLACRPLTRCPTRNLLSSLTSIASPQRSVCQHIRRLSPAS